MTVVKLCKFFFENYFKTTLVVIQIKRDTILQIKLNFFSGNSQTTACHQTVTEKKSSGM